MAIAVAAVAIAVAAVVVVAVAAVVVVAVAAIVVAAVAAVVVSTVLVVPIAGATSAGNVIVVTNATILSDVARDPRGFVVKARRVRRVVLMQAGPRARDRAHG